MGEAKRRETSTLEQLCAEREMIWAQIRATHPALPRPDLSPEAIAKRAPLFERLDYLTACIRELKQPHP